MEEMLQVGVITAPHGIKGDVKVFPTTDDPARFKKLKHVFLDRGNEKINLEITQVKFFKQFVILHFKEFDDINEVEGFRKCPLLVDRENAVKLKENEYFIADLIGLNVIDDTEQTLGTLTDVLQTGANDVYVVEGENEKEILIPAIKQCILEIDMQNRKMVVHLLKGLVEE